MVRQEDYNSIMRHPGENRDTTRPIDLPKCPACEERYMGNGRDLCIDCEIDTKNLEDHLQDAFPINK